MFLSHFLSKKVVAFRTYECLFCSVNLQNLRFKSNVRLGNNNRFLKLFNKFEPSVKTSYSYNKVFSRNLSQITSFQHMQDARKKQAQCSVLLELKSKEDIPYAVSSCEHFGIIKQAYSYKGVSENVFVLLEFNEENSVRELLLSSSYKNISDVFPVFTRILGYSKNSDRQKPKFSIDIMEDVRCAAPLEEGTVSDLINNVYMAEKLTDLNIRLRFLFCCVVKELLAGPFPFCDAIPFGSSVNGVGRHGCDLDLMIRLYPKEVYSSELHFVNKTCVGDIQNLQRRVVYCVGDMLRAFSAGVTSVQKILNARVPIIKLEHRILGMKVDISVNNLAPILMSELLHFWGEVDARVRPLIYAVKKWAREANVTYESPGSWISNFSLTLLVIFFLQNRPVPILPTINESIHIKGAEFTEEYKLEYLMSLSELQSRASLNKESLAVLLKEFFTFLGSHPFEYKHISLFTGKATEHKTDSAIWVQYPFEESLNVSKNVSEHELFDMCEKARVSAKCLDSNLKLRNPQSRNLSAILGIPTISKLGQNKGKRIDVSSLLGESMNKKPGRRRAV